MSPLSSCGCALAEIPTSDFIEKTTDKQKGTPSTSHRPAVPNFKHLSPPTHAPKRLPSWLSQGSMPLFKQFPPHTVIPLICPRTHNHDGISPENNHRRVFLSSILTSGSCPLSLSVPLEVASEISPAQSSTCYSKLTLSPRLT